MFIFCSPLMFLFSRFGVFYKKYKRVFSFFYWVMLNEFDVKVFESSCLSNELTTVTLLSGITIRDGKREKERKLFHICNMYVYIHSITKLKMFFSLLYLVIFVYFVKFILVFKKGVIFS